jgi:hypothetical protein
MKVDTKPSKVSTSLRERERKREREREREDRKYKRELVCRRLIPPYPLSDLKKKEEELKVKVKVMFAGCFHLSFIDRNFMNQKPALRMLWTINISLMLICI